MKNLLKTLFCVCILTAAFLALCSCCNGVSDMRRRERILRERQERERLAGEEQAPPEEELDPDFLFDTNREAMLYLSAKNPL